VPAESFVAGAEVVALRGIYSGCGPHNVTPRLRVKAKERGIVATREPDWGNASLVPVWFTGRDTRTFCRPEQLRILP
jgi:hypothetical protein